MSISWESRVAVRVAMTTLNSTKSLKLCLKLPQCREKPQVLMKRSTTVSTERLSCTHQRVMCVSGVKEKRTKRVRLRWSLLVFCENPALILFWRRRGSSAFTRHLGCKCLGSGLNCEREDRFSYVVVEKHARKSANCGRRGSLKRENFFQFFVFILNGCFNYFS